MVEEYEVRVTHKMTFTSTDLIRVNLKTWERFKKYDSIESIIWITVGNFAMYAEVTGTRTINGYKVENGGFYDIGNDVFYFQFQIDDFKNVSITESQGFIKEE